ncbi:DUF6807 domain-containing protein [Microbacterium resistens]|uniref:DUF6807 domain-containing protein n=1 Tax=Microbacterium resistens TaxID=156977 RepID=UPI00366F383C
MSAVLPGLRPTDRGWAVVHDGVEIAHYATTPDPAPFEGPKPYLHPLRTLAGDVVTNHRPHDHRWHKGLQLTCTDLSGANLWGGNTWVQGEGYVPLDNVGRMDADGPVAAADGALSHRLVWRTARGDDLVREERRLAFRAHDGVTWSLEWRSTLTALTPEPLSFGSPATRGLPGSGYSGLMWRGPRSFSGGRVLLPSGETPEEDARGAEAAWLAFVGAHDGVDRSSTLVFEPILTPDRIATRWFVRSAEFAIVNPSWAFTEPFPLAPGESIDIAHRVTVADGAWDVEDVERHRVEATR